MPEERPSSDFDSEIATITIDEAETKPKRGKGISVQDWLSFFGNQLRKGHTSGESIGKYIDIDFIKDLNAFIKQR